MDCYDFFMTDPTDKTAATWMLTELQAQGVLYQEEAVYSIQEKFGDDFVYLNDNGNLAISRSVLKEFRLLTGEDFVWERGERCWRFRQQYDQPGRQQ